MNSSERDIFSRLEHEMSRDLTQWRRDITASFESYCQIAIEMEEVRAGDAPNIGDTTVVNTIKRHTIDFLIADWTEHPDSPHRGDYVSATGESYWYAFDEENDRLRPYRLPMGYKIEGPFVDWRIEPYITEAGLEKRVRRNTKEEHQYTHPFGLHLILQHPAVISDAGIVLPIHPERIYLPLHYERTTLRVYPSA